MQRDSTTKEKIESRMRQQLTEQEILSLSDYQIINDGEADVHSQVLELLSKLKDGKQQYFWNRFFTKRNWYNNGVKTIISAAKDVNLA